MSGQNSTIPIPQAVMNMMNREGIIFIGTCSKTGIPNVSTRTAFVAEEGSLLWCSWFKNKTYENFAENNHVSVAVVDSSRLAGYQMKGQVERILDSDKITDLMKQAMSKPRHARFNQMVNSQAHAPVMITKFKVEEVYSLAPIESSLSPIPVRELKEWSEREPAPG